MSTINLESLNFPGHFIRHAGFLGELTRRGGPVNDFAFTLVSRGSGKVAVRSVNFRDRFLRHRDFRIRLEGPAGPGDDLWMQDSTFFFEQGLADREGVSFRSLDVPDRCLRHRDFHLVLERRGRPTRRCSGGTRPSFRRPAAVQIEDGTELHPV
jgi:hypothetical protein